MKKLPKLDLSKKIALAILVVFVFSTMTLTLIQQKLYSSNNEAILADLKTSVLEMKRDAARDLMREVKIATESSLQRGEFVQFMHFAQQQKQLEEIRAFSFVGKTGSVELSSDSERIGQPIAGSVWQQAQAKHDVFIVENDDTFSFYCPLRVDADMRRLQPDTNTDDLYGALHLEFSKDNVNQMLAEAENACQIAQEGTYRIVLLLATFAAGIVLIVAWLISTSLTKRLRMAVTMLKDIAVGEGDLTKRISMRAVNCSAAKGCNQADCSE